MRSPFLPTSLCLLAFGLVLGCGESLAETPKPESAIDRASYGVGLNMGRSFGAQGFDVNLDLFIQGIRDGAGEAEPLLTEEEIKTAVQEVQRQIAAAQQAKQKELGEKNAAESEAFLTANASREGVVTRESGLQYEVLTEGVGPTPSADDRVKVHYKGTLVGGQQFDSSYDRDEPVVFALKGLIPAWIEALPLMRVGSKWKLYVPADLGYGESGAGNVIGPNAALIFEIELLGIEPPESTE